MKATMVEPHLDPQTKEFIDKLESKPSTPIYKLSPQEARKVLETVQSTPIEKNKVTIEEKTLPDTMTGHFTIKIYRPEGSKGTLPVIMYVHGAGWVMGSDKTHEYLVSKLCVDSNSAVVFVNYSLSPEARFPVAIEQIYIATKYIYDNGKSMNLDTSNFTIAGDSVGGNMAIATTLQAKERKDVKITKQLLFYPVTSSEMNTPSYQQFAEGPWLTKPSMEYFWNAYEEDPVERKNILLSPLNASIDQLKGLPPALIITAENDVLRDEGEAYAHKLMQAGVNVAGARMFGTIHDFLMLNGLSKTPPAKEAIAMAIKFLKEGT